MYLENWKQIAENVKKFIEIEQIYHLSNALRLYQRWVKNEWFLNKSLLVTLLIFPIKHPVLKLQLSYLSFFDGINFKEHFFLCWVF